MSTADDTKTVRITVRSAHSLVKDRISLPGQPDPYAVVSAGSNQTFTTKSVKGTLNPTWNEHFDITIRRSSTITIRVCYGRILRIKAKFLGSVTIKGVEAFKHSETPGSLVTSDITNGQNVCGKLLFSFSLPGVQGDQIAQSSGLPATVEQPQPSVPASPQRTCIDSPREAEGELQDEADTSALSRPAEEPESLSASSQEPMDTLLLPQASPGQQGFTVRLPERERYFSTPSTTSQQSRILSIQHTAADEQNHVDASTTPTARVEDQLSPLASHAPLYGPPAGTALQGHTDKVLTSLPLLERLRLPSSPTTSEPSSESSSSFSDIVTVQYDLADQIPVSSVLTQPKYTVALPVASHQTQILPMRQNGTDHPPSILATTQQSQFTPSHAGAYPYPAPPAFTSYDPRAPSLPSGWEKRYTREGQPYFVDHNRKVTAWSEPAALPIGWEKRYTAADRPYFVDHINQRTTWVDPRAATVTFDNLPVGWEVRPYSDRTKIFRES
ncbi:hypothetical protein EDC04DRAFT_1757491 [Pisolithus marmoratus]|nr:hypothetical protein EDC04DRAFT_1757491 [Pisolithus marmoratus]